MKRKISLYIGNKPADLSTDSLVQMSYTAEDLSDPAIVKNSYSQQVTLPATRNNDAIFGGIFRADRRTIGGDGSTGANFSPLVRTPFVIYDEAGELLESGYIKLDSITAKDGSPAYVITLYGGLGSFFYTLSYDDEGNEMTLGNLPLIGETADEQIEFTINKETVSDAWAALRNNTAGQWQVINFAPAYNGLPDGEFDADKAVGDPVTVGGEDKYEDQDSNKTYTLYDDNALYDLGEEFTEWETKDLRSYLQRPVASVKGLIEGISNLVKIHGFTMELDPVFFSSINPYYSKAWMTLPLLSTVEQKAEEGTLKISGNVVSDEIYVGRGGTAASRILTPSLTISDANVNASVKLRPALGSTKLSPSYVLYLTRDGVRLDDVGTVLFAQLILKDASGRLVGGSKLQIFMTDHLYAQPSAEELVQMAGVLYYSQYGINETIVYDKLHSCPPLSADMDWWATTEGATLEASGYGATTAEVFLLGAVIKENNGGYDFYDEHPIYVSRGDDSRPDILQYMDGWGGIIENASLAYKTQGGLRSGSKVTQVSMFADTMTPAAFLLSYSKMFGLSYVYDKGTKVVKLMTRNALYDGEVVDLQTRIDRSKEIKTTPMAMSTKWLSFSPGDIGGEYTEFYKQKYGRGYGEQRVNTGYDFNADTKDVLESMDFDGGAEVLEKSKYFNNVTFKGFNHTPSPFLNGKATYRLYYEHNPEDYVELEGLTPDHTASITPFNELSTYDAIPKLQCHGQDNSGISGSGILLFHRGCAADDEQAAAAYARFIITDDSSAMYDLNDKACWELSDGILAANMPIFGRHFMDGSEIMYSMDFGTPAELDIPFVTVREDAFVYARSWQKYIEDRYNVDTRVRSAYVDLRGIQVGEHLLRKFYFADNAIWTLNKISNYLLTGVGTTQCEFVKVQDRKAYTEGQLIDTYYLTLNGSAGDISVDVVVDGGQTDITYNTNGTLQILSYSGDAIRNAVISGSVISIYSDLNTSSEQRAGQVIVTLKESPRIKRTITVVQAGAVTPTLKLDFDEAMPWAATRHTVGIINTSDIDIKVWSLPSWFISVHTPFTIEQGRTYRMGIYENDSEDTRTGIIDIRDEYGRYKTDVEVSQKGVTSYDPSVSFSETLPWSTYDAPITMTNNGNVDLEVISIPDWFLYTGVPHDLPQGEIFAFGISQNTTGEFRSGTVGMRYQNATGQYVDYNVEVSQKGTNTRMVIIDASIDPSLAGQDVIASFEVVGDGATGEGSVQIADNNTISLTFEQVSSYLGIEGIEYCGGDTLRVMLPDYGYLGDGIIPYETGDVHIVLKK